jgi:phenylalanyl-tRNA synthetase beta chain
MRKKACVSPVCLAVWKAALRTAHQSFSWKALISILLTIRKTSFRHGLRTDAATRFEKGMDISATLSVLERAAFLVKEVAGGVIASLFYRCVSLLRSRRAEVVLTYGYLKKLSGKAYAPPQSVMAILKSLGFEIINETADAIDRSRAVSQT